MAETKINTDNSGNQVRHSNPATIPLPSSAGQPITVTSAGTGARPSVHGTVAGVVFDNPGQ